VAAIVCNGDQKPPPGTKARVTVDREGNADVKQLTLAAPFAGTQTGPEELYLVNQHFTVQAPATAVQRVLVKDTVNGMWANGEPEFTLGVPGGGGAGTVNKTVCLKWDAKDHELERSIMNAVNVARSVARDPHFVAGAGATEIELAHQVQQFGATVPGLDQYAVLKFAEALEVVPKVLADNAGHSYVDVITAMYAAHQKGEKSMGVDVEGSPGALLLNATEKGLLDHEETKRWALRFSVDAVLTILRVDQIIMAKQAGGPKGGGEGGRDDD
jgi:hypothetical protein